MEALTAKEISAEIALSKRIEDEMDLWAYEEARAEASTANFSEMTIPLPRYNEETEAAIQESRDIMSGKKYAKTYSSARELFDELDAESRTGEVDLNGDVDRGGGARTGALASPVE